MGALARDGLTGVFKRMLSEVGGDLRQLPATMARRAITYRVNDSQNA
jgi:hypothetical protein